MFQLRMIVEEESGHTVAETLAGVAEAGVRRLVECVIETNVFQPSPRIAIGENAQELVIGGEDRVRDIVVPGLEDDMREQIERRDVRLLADQLTNHAVVLVFILHLVWIVGREKLARKCREQSPCEQQLARETEL